MNEGEFSNINNNPLWQTKRFNPVKARYIKLRALKNTQNNDAVGCAEVDVITDWLSHQLSAISHQLSAISYQLSAIAFGNKFM